MPPTSKKTPKPTTPPPGVPAQVAASPAPSAANPPGIVERSEVKGSGKAKAPTPRQVSNQEIEIRAYEIFAGRGYAPGDPIADWLEAERQLKAGL